MKNILISSLILASFATPALSYAQVSEPATQAQVSQLETTLRELLLQLIAQLQTQINDLLAQQASTTQMVAEVKASLPSSPVLGAVSAQPTLKAITLGTPYCGKIPTSLSSEGDEDVVKIPISIDGESLKTAIHRFNSLNLVVTHTNFDSTGKRTEGGGNGVGALGYVWLTKTLWRENMNFSEEAYDYVSGPSGHLEEKLVASGPQQTLDLSNVCQ